MKLTTNYSAGVLLYTVIECKIYVLLGCDVKYNCWSDFGGKCEVVDNNNPIKTAAREFYEETSGIISDELTLYTRLKNDSICLNCKSYNNNNYYMYLLKDEHEHGDSNKDRSKDYTQDFDKQQFLLKIKPVHTDVKRYIEKCKLKWFLLEDIINNPSENFRGVFISSIQNNIKVIKEKCVIV
jgi:hypothetical protein